jgi:hypothetical protein
LLSPESAAELERLREQLAAAGDSGAQAFQRAGENGALAIEQRLEIERLRERVAELEAAPALPWAAQMSDGDLHGFLDDLVSAAMNRWRSEPDVPDRETLAAIEKACAEWRTPGQGFRSDDEAVAS